MPVFDRFKLTGRCALVTGGSRGLGWEMAGALAEAGAEVVIAGSDAAHLQNACEVLRSEGHSVRPVQADLSRPAEAERLCEVLLRDFPAIDILINNVGG